LPFNYFIHDGVPNEAPAAEQPVCWCNLLWFYTFSSI